MSLNNQPCMTRPTLNELGLDGYNQGLCYYPFMVELDRCNVNCNTFDDQSSRICSQQNEKRKYKLFFTMITEKLVKNINKICNKKM